jgi:quercetin dioxygenase-like cupin family protein
MNDAPILTFDLPTLIEKLKHSNKWAKGELNAMILLDGPYRQIVLTALQKGTEINSFQSSDSITFQTIEGKLQLYFHHETVILNKGQLLTLYENVKYRLTSREESVFLLTIASGSMGESAES